jgi:hypothetical protein
MNTLLSSPVLSWLLSYLFNALWQIPLLFAAAWIAARMLRGAHPGFGHRVWVGALLLQVMLPACALRFDPLWHALPGLFPTTSTPDAGGVRVAFGSIVATGGTLRLPFAFETAVIFVWACCLLYFAVRLVWGLRQTRILARSASRITLTGDTHSPGPGTAIGSESPLHHRRLPPRHRELARSQLVCGAACCCCRPHFSKASCPATATPSLPTN